MSSFEEKKEIHQKLEHFIERQKLKLPSYLQSLKLSSTFQFDRINEEADFLNVEVQATICLFISFVSFYVLTQNTGLSLIGTLSSAVTLVTVLYLTQLNSQTSLAAAVIVCSVMPLQLINSYSLFTTLLIDANPDTLITRTTLDKCSDFLKLTVVVSVATFPLSFSNNKMIASFQQTLALTLAV